MNHDLTMHIHNLCIRYYQLRVSEDTLRRYDDESLISNQYNKEVREILFKGVQINDQLYNEQYELVEKLIDEKLIDKKDENS